MTVKLPGPGGERKSPSARIGGFIRLVMGHHETIGWIPRRSGPRRGVDAGALLPVRHNAEGMARPATAYGGLFARQQRRQLHRFPVASRPMREDEYLAPGDSHGCPGAGHRRPAPPCTHRTRRWPDLRDGSLARSACAAPLTRWSLP